jgi:DNA-binding CsgD family transcriptional regulator/tetratricopeptide (TPR) repeat protein
VVNERVFVGRNDELARIMSCVAAAADRRAQVVWVEGEAGSGKTAVVRRVVDALPQDFSVLRAEADELSRDETLGVASQFGPLAAGTGFAAGVELLALFATAQDGGPVAVVVEDVHWADVPSRQALLTVARRLENDRVVMLLTSRSDPGAADGWDRFCQDPDHCARVVLGALSSAEVLELALGMGVALTTKDAARLHRHTGGHPLYARTLLSELTPEQLAEDGELPAPRSLASTTLARLAALPADARALSSALAVVNQRVPLGVAGRVAGVVQPTEALESLLATGFVRWWPAEAQTPVEFAHPLYRAAAYDDLSPTKRQRLHRAAAEVLDAGAALAHRVAATDHVDDDLADEVDRAAGRELGQGDVSLATRYLLWASSLSSSRERAEHRLLEAARLLLAAGQAVRAGALRPQVEACDQSPLRSLVLGTLAWDDGDAVTAERWLLGASVAIGPNPIAADRQVVARALAQLGGMYATQGRAPDAIDVATRALALGPVDPRVERLAWMALALGVGRLRGAPAGLDRLTDRLPQAAEAVSSGDADLLVTRGSIGFYAGRTTAAIADLRAAINLGRQGAVISQLDRAHFHLANLLLNSGDWDEALVHARLALSVVADERRVWMEAQAHSAISSLLASRGEWDAAEGHAKVAGDAAAALGTSEAVFTARIAQSNVARARNEPAGVVDALAPLAGGGQSEAITMFTSLGWWPTLIVATIECGHNRDAVRQVDQLEVASAERGLDLHARIVGLRARVAVAQGRPAEATIGFEEAIALLGPDDLMLDRALLHHEFGRLLLAQGSRRRASDQLRAAHQLLARSGAEPYRRRVAADLEACGVRSGPPGSAKSRSPLALTDREHDVATLVAKGRSNREAGTELYISEKAVEYHLGNVFAKLGINSRRQLRDRALN